MDKKAMPLSRKGYPAWLQYGLLKKIILSSLDVMLQTPSFSGPKLHSANIQTNSRPSSLILIRRRL